MTRSYIHTIGYARWDTQHRMGSLLKALRGVGITLLVDIRHSPCSSQLEQGNYGPKGWNLQVEGGIERELRDLGIQYLWLGELGNPQKNDPAMTILRAHIRSADLRWPVNRGLEKLHHLIEEGQEKMCLLCACAKYAHCHRSVVAEALSARYYSGKLNITDLG